jgi:hypothetical protein
MIIICDVKRGHKMTRYEQQLWDTLKEITNFDLMLCKHCLKQITNRAGCDTCIFKTKTGCSKAVVSVVRDDYYNKVINREKKYNMDITQAYKA